VLVIELDILAKEEKMKEKLKERKKKMKYFSKFSTLPIEVKT
jgi:hypothetical protein